jgi:WD40 repeat protein
MSGRDDFVHLINFPGWTEGFVFKGSAHEACDCVVNAVTWSPDSLYIASGDRDGTVEVWQVKTRTLITTYKGHTADVFALAWSPNGRYLASGGVDHTVQVWLATTGIPLLTYRGHSNDVAALAWSPDSRLIASGSWDRTVQVWQATYSS